MGREAKIYKKLTRKQTLFVKELAEGRTATQAVMATYNVSDSKTASVIASQNLNKLSIKEALEVALRTNGLTVDVIASNIGNIANKVPEKLSGETVLRANIELLKLHGAYPGKKNSRTLFNAKTRVETMSYDEARRELERIRVETQELVSEVDE